MADIADQLSRGRESRQTGRNAGISVPADKVEHPFIFVIFFVAVLQPFTFTIGSTLFSPYRVVLMILFIPAILKWLSGAAGPKILPDFLMLGYTAWMYVALFANQGVAATTMYAFSQTIEVTGAYFLGRAYIRNVATFLFFVKCFLFSVALLLPFALFEGITGETLINNLYRKIPGIKVFNVVDYVRRMGLRRAQVTFNHPILYGVFCMTSVSLAWVALKARGYSTFKRSIWTAVTVLATFLSVSSGALAGIVVQVILNVWEAVMINNKKRWKLFMWLGISLYIFLDIFSSHPPIVALVGKLTFSGATAWNRYQIWQYGSAEVMRHPIFGMGTFGYWIRAPWMPLSLDNHWLLMAMRYGLPGVTLLMGTFLVMLFRLGRLDLGNDPRLNPIRQSLLFSLAGVIVALGTVACKEGAYSTIMCLLGSGAWLFHAAPRSGAAPPPGPPGRTRRPVSRAGPGNPVAQADPQPPPDGPGRGSGPGSGSGRPTSRYARPRPDGNAPRKS